MEEGNTVEKLAHIVEDEFLCSIYEEYLVLRFAWENLGFLLDVQRYREIESYEQRKQLAHVIYDKFLDENAPFELGDIRNEVREALRHRLDEAQPGLFNSLVKKTSLALAHSTILDFIEDPLYKQYQAIKSGEATPEVPLEFDHVYKLIMLGDSSVGKSSIMLRHVRGKFEEKQKSTTGPEFSVHNSLIEGKMIKSQIWDTAGQEKFMAITKGYYRNAMGVLLVYDVTSKESFNHLNTWINEIRTWAHNTAIMIVGNKIDLKNQRQVTYEDGQKFSEQHNAQFIETSAVNGTNVSQAFETLLTGIYHTLRENGGPEYSSLISKVLSNNNSNNNSNSNGGCCKF